jgi:(4S)-4-hydroxy-5-phosphonooxypentane-2,3-dione isomerase
VAQVVFDFALSYPRIDQAKLDAKHGISTGERVMHIVHVDIHVKPEFVEQFIVATIDNASNSVQEPGVVRFDFVQQADDPTRFVLVEIYLTPADGDTHKQTAHYARWRDTVANMMVEARVGTKYVNILPTDENWK